MELSHRVTSPKFHIPKTLNKNRAQISPSSSTNPKIKTTKPPKTIPTMSDILKSSKSQNIDLKLQTIGPFFRITAKTEKTGEIGRAEGLIRFNWNGEKILHLDKIQMKKESVEMEKSIFGIGLFIGAVAIRYGYDSGCEVAELLAINDTPLYHTKLIRFYKRIGFKPVYEVTGSTFGDMSHMLVWGGVGTLMKADVKYLLLKWFTRFTPNTESC